MEDKILLRFDSVISGIFYCMRTANERRCYNVTSSLIGLVHAQDDWCYIWVYKYEHKKKLTRGEGMGCYLQVWILLYLISWLLKQLNNVHNEKMFNIDYHCLKIIPGLVLRMCKISMVLLTLY